MRQIVRRTPCVKCGSVTHYIETVRNFVEYSCTVCGKVSYSTDPT